LKAKLQVFQSMWMIRYNIPDFYEAESSKGKFFFFLPVSL